MPERVQTVSMRLLRRHTEFVKGIGHFMTLKALGNDEAAKQSYQEFRIRFGAYEVELERYFDHFLAFRDYKQILDAATKLAEEAG